jgi:hypothetical protein
LVATDFCEEGRKGGGCTGCAILISSSGLNVMKMDRNIQTESNTSAAINYSSRQENFEPIQSTELTRRPVEHSVTTTHWLLL